MKSVKKILLGIAVILCGGVITTVNGLEYIGWVTSVIGLGVAIIGYFSSSNE